MSEPSPNFSKVELTELLDTLSERLRRKRAVARLYVIGGACMALAYGRGRSRSCGTPGADSERQEDEARSREDRTCSGGLMGTNMAAGNR